MQPDDVSGRPYEAESRRTLWYAFLISVLVALLGMPRTSISC
jgi:hypothetical protein